MVKYCSICEITLALIIDLVTPLVGLGLGLGIDTYHNVQLFKWVTGKAKCTSPFISSLDTCGSDRKRFLKARQNHLANVKALIPTLTP